ncbi:MAG: PQQ-binding-like beta-propeller repeat protein, partial [Pirellulales bacterium]|nr:PQQ-binding-like beta-propeller repeat protein [Pirellulales bacterium]
MRPIYLAIFGWALLHVSTSATAQDWPRFRGPNGSGVSSAKTVPTKWTKDDFNWVVELPGSGHSSPVVWGEKLFVTSADEDAGKYYVICIDTGRGAITWQKAFGFAKQKKHKKNSFATNTPAVDADHVYVLQQNSEDSRLIALDHTGDQVWSHSVGPFKSGHGTGVSPIVHKDLVVVANDHGGASSLLGIDRMTGKQRWKIDRTSSRASYSTPCVFHPKGREPELIFTDMHHGITAVDPTSGKVNWEISVFGTFKQRAIASPVVVGDLVIGSSGFTTAEKNVVAVRPSADGSKAKEVYRVSKTVPHIPTPLIYNGLMFLWTDRGGIVSCYDAKTGKQHWIKRIGGDFWGSPICIDGKIYAADGDGRVHVIRAADKFELVAENDLGFPTSATP